MENFDNPADLKTVHLGMEVVALKNARPEAPLVPFFSVLVQGDRYDINTYVVPSSFSMVHLTGLILDERTVPLVSVRNFRSTRRYSK